MEALSGTPFREDVERAFDKLAAGLTPHMRQFLDQLPHVIAAKPDAMHGRPVDEAADSRRQQVIARALEATLHRRQATITYHSRSSQRTKPYLVHPYRLAHALGGLYLLAYVPEYRGSPDLRGGTDLRRSRCWRTGSRRSKSCQTPRFPIRSACTRGRQSPWRSSSKRRPPTTSAAGPGTGRRPFAICPRAASRWR